MPTCNKSLLYIGNLKSSFQRDLFLEFRKRITKVSLFFAKPPYTFFKKIKIFLSLFWSLTFCDIVFVEFISDFAYIVSKIKRYLIKKPKIVLRCHRAELYEYYERFPNRFKSAAMAADLIICVSEGTKKRLVEIAPYTKEKIRVVYNGVDTQRFYPMERNKQDKFTVGSLGYLTPRKGFEELITVISQLIKNDGLNIFLKIGGRGELMGRLKELARQLNINEFVEFSGFIEDENLPKWYNSLDLFVLNSKSEGHPLVVLEAMSCGLPVIATNVGGIPEVLDSAWLYNPGDTERLKKLIKYFYSLPTEERKAIGLKNRKIIEEKFCLANQADKIVELVCSLT